VTAGRALAGVAIASLLVAAACRRKTPEVATLPREHDSLTLVRFADFIDHFRFDKTPVTKKSVRRQIKLTELL